jgi:hypothetical protein
MIEELGRATAIRLPSTDPPFFVAYTVDDERRYEADATFGALTWTNETHRRPAKIEVRAGLYEFDSSEFVRSWQVPDPVRRELPVTNDVLAMRREFWLGTDAAYKQALEQLAAKRATLGNRVRTDTLPDFTRETPVSVVGPRADSSFDLARWGEVTRRLSALFRGYPLIAQSEVELRVRLMTHYFVTSEGTVVRQPETLVVLAASARTRAADGSEIADEELFIAPDAASLPGEEEMASRVRALAQRVSDIESAPRMEAYTGPVLVGGQASGELFGQIFAANVNGQRPPSAQAEEREASAPQSEFVKRVGRFVLPRFLHVVDDPTATVYGAERLIGTYAIDDQGVRAGRLDVVTAGKLRTLFASRRPRTAAALSNGRARAANSWPLPQASNFFVTVSPGEGRTMQRLVQQMLDLCRAQDVPYGVIVTRISTSPTSYGERPAIADPVVMYRVWADDGRRELVRGASFGDLGARTFKDILAASDSLVVTHRLSTTYNGQVVPAADALDAIPSSVIAPAVLVEELEIKPQTGGREKPPVLAHPFFSAAKKKVPARGRPSR